MYKKSFLKDKVDLSGFLISDNFKFEMQNTVQDSVININDQGSN